MQNKIYRVDRLALPVIGPLSKIDSWKIVLFDSM